MREAVSLTLLLLFLGVVALTSPEAGLIVRLPSAAEEAALPYEADPALTVPDTLPEDAQAFNVFRSIVQGTEGNILFSPAGLEESLHLLQEFSGGATREAIDRQPMGERGVAGAMQVRSATALFADSAAKLKPTSHPVIPLPLSSDAEAAAKAIDSWAEKHTDGRLPSLRLPLAQPLSPSACIAVNTLHIKERWLRPFDAADTLGWDFHLADGSTRQVEMMNQSADFRLAEGEDWRAVALFFRTDGRTGEPGCFIGILPKGDARAFAATLTAQKFNGIRLALARAEVRHVYIALPKMKVETPPLPLKEALEASGLGIIFRTDADFSGLADSPLYVADISQICYAEVDELGTEAAAATPTSINLAAYDPAGITFDKPFIWAVTDLTSGAPPLFLGLFENP